MDNIRLILILALVFVLMLIWQAWEQDYGQPRPSPQVETAVLQLQRPHALFPDGRLGSKIVG